MEGAFSHNEPLLEAAFILQKHFVVVPLISAVVPVLLAPAKSAGKAVSVGQQLVSFALGQVILPLALVLQRLAGQLALSGELVVADGTRVVGSVLEDQVAARVVAEFVLEAAHQDRAVLEDDSASAFGLVMLIPLAIVVAV